VVGEVRAAFAVARKDIRSFSRYRIAVAGTVFTPLYQFIIPRQPSAPKTFPDSYF